MDDEYPAFDEYRGFLIIKGDETAEIPLWNYRGPLFASAAQMVEEGFPPEVVADLVRWADDWRLGPSDELHLRALAFRAPLRRVLAGQYTIVYEP